MNTRMYSKDNGVARKSLRKRIANMLRKPTTPACAGAGCANKLTEERTWY